MTGVPEPHEKRDLRRAADTAAATADAAPAPAESPATPAPARKRRAPLSRQELERLRRSLKARFH